MYKVRIRRCIYTFGSLYISDDVYTVYIWHLAYDNVYIHVRLALEDVKEMRCWYIWHVACICVWHVTFAYATCLIYIIISGIHTCYMITSCVWHVPLMCVWPVTSTYVPCERDMSHSRLAPEVVNEVGHTRKSTHSYVGRALFKYGLSLIHDQGHDSILRGAIP